MPNMLVCGEVEKVDEENMLCLINTDGEEEKVVASLVIGEGSKGVVQVPKVGSMVLVGMIGNANGFLLMSEENDKIIINGGENKGLVKIEELKENLEKMTKRIDGIIEAIKGGVCVPKDGGSSLQQTITARLNSLTDKEQFDAIEDEKVLH